MKSKYNTYIRKLTKEDLIKGGIKEITEDCKVIFEDGRVLEKEEDFQRNKKGYFYFYVDELGPNGLSINKYYNDGSFIVSSKEFIKTINFPNGFNENGEFILITAGGNNNELG